MSLDPRVLTMLKEGRVPPGVTMGAVAPHLSLPDDVIEELMKRAADEEAYKRELNTNQNLYAKAGRALEVIVNMEQLKLCKAKSFSDNDDLKLARETRRAALNVIKSYLSQ
jgi:hypothetical protein